MFSRGFWFLGVCLCTVFFMLFGITGLWNDDDMVAYAANVSLTPAETRGLIGDTIPAQYYDGSSMVDFDFIYGGTATLGSINVDGSPSLSFAPGDTVLWYSAQISPNMSPQYITVDVRSRYSFFDTDYITQMCGLTCDTVPGVSAYSPPSWRWHTSYSGDLIIESQYTANTYYYAICDVSINNVRQHFTFIDAQFSQQSTFSAYSDRALFYGNGAVSGYVYFIVSCPVVTDTSTMASGTIGGTSGTGDINVVVDVDLTETNGLLSSIADLLSGLVTGIKNLFIPTEQDILDFKTNLDQLLQTVFGPLYTAQSLLHNALTQLDSIEVQDSVLFPGISLLLAGSDFTIAAQSVALDPSGGDVGFAYVLESLRLLIDIISTCAFINMCRDKLVYIMTGYKDKGGG